MAKKHTLRDTVATVTITGMSADGRGTAELDGRSLVIDGALLGETVQFRFTSVRQARGEGIVEEVLDRSPSRIDPRCPHFQICAGCSRQHVLPEVQIAEKQLQLSTLLSQHEVAADRWVPPLQTETWEYRRRARLGVRYVDKKEKTLVGFHEKRNRYIADIESCAVLVPELSALIPQFKLLIDTLESKRSIPQIEASVGDKGRIAIILRHLDELPVSDREKLLAFADDKQLDLYLQPGGLDTVTKVAPAGTSERLSYSLPTYDLELLFHPLDFLQVNADLNKKMIDLALDLLDLSKHDRVLDLFCGLGNFTLPIARRARSVVGVEGSEAMVSRGYENARHNDITNAEFFCHDLTKELVNAPWAKEGFTKILIDPPRSGALEVIQEIARFGAARIAYVSCNPETLARDAAELVKRGYRMLSTGVMDMFPHTTHVESIALFERC